MTSLYTSIDHLVLLPAILLALFGCAVLLADIFRKRTSRASLWLPLTALLGEAFTAIALWRQHQYLGATGVEIVGFGGSLTIDGLALFFNWIFLGSAVVVILISYRYLDIEDNGAGDYHGGEYYGLVLIAQAGMFFLAAGTELVTLFVGLETMAISFYVLVGLLRGTRRSNEAAMKYLLLGAFSSGFLAYGFSILYGLSGSTGVREIMNALSARDPLDPLVLLAVVTTSVGLFFKIAAAPFHVWAPDVYEGAPTPVTAYLAAGSKAASLAFLLRILTGALQPARDAWLPLVIAVCVVSLLVGNLAALTQNNVKRLLAYSSISHAGYLLLGVVAGNERGLHGVALYMAVYAFMTLGAFAVLIALRREGIKGEDISDFRGLVQRNPGYAFLMLLFLMSLAGIPPTAGFIGKYFIFVALIETGHYALAVLGAAYIAVALYYYFRIVRTMFEAHEARPLESSAGVRLALVLTAAVTLGAGIYPEPVVRATQSLLPMSQSLLPVTRSLLP